MFTEEELKGIAERREKWASDTLPKLPPQKSKFETISGIPIKDIYTPEDIQHLDYVRDLGFPGEYPYTRGPYPSMYRGRHWTIRQIAGMGSAKATNERHKYLMAHGQTGLSNDFDVPTLLGMDSDDPAAEGEVGRNGVIVDSLEDMESLYEGIPLDEANHSFTINHPTLAILSIFLALAEKQGIPFDKLRGTTQNDPLKECYCMKVYSFPPRPSVKLLVDTWEYTAEHLPRWNISNINAYPIRDSGANVYQELGSNFAAVIEYLEAAAERGIGIDSIAPNISFMWYVHKDLLEEIAKFRASRRMWARIARDRFGAKNPRSLLLRFHVQTGGAVLTYQQPENNIIRGTIQTLAAVLGGAQSIGLACYDEALSIPSEKAHRLAVRTQQIIAYESGVTDVVDPFAGSYYMESLTNELEERAWDVIKDIEGRGGLAKCTEDGYLDRLLSMQAYQYMKEIENKERIVVGVNEFIEEEEEQEEVFRVLAETEEEQINNLRRLRDERSNQQVQKCLADLRRAAERGENVMPYCVEAAKVYATEGEMMGILKDVYGEYSAPAVF